MATLLKLRAGADRLGMRLMITSFVVIAGFTYWLSVTAKPTEILPPDQKDELANLITFAQFSTGPDEYLGEVVSLEDIEIVANFGNHGHWINLEDVNRNGYLLHVSDSVRADTTAVSRVAEGTTVAVTGRVVATTDSVLDVWEAAGAFTGPADRIVAQGTRYLNFIEVTGIRVLETPPPGGGGSGSG